MRDLEKELEFLQEAIDKHGMMEIWADGLFAETEQEKQDLANKRAAKAKENYSRMMSSRKNDGSGAYRVWAMNKAFGLHIGGIKVNVKGATHPRR